MSRLPAPALLVCAATPTGATSGHRGGGRLPLSRRHAKACLAMTVHSAGQTLVFETFSGRCETED
ncbi:hypothetical protein [Nioella nitratireducens]|uniref:hypothetical protein n=1 Tax=Nioella nitratireducens TaxID=1287720 RepID=UPI0008FD65AE|nr:hypothetical protein [Nioella nitratireducens]